MAWVPLWAAAHARSVAVASAIPVA
jgi:hypothetical protein